MNTLVICWEAVWILLAIIIGTTLLVKLIIDMVDGKRYAKILGSVILVIVGLAVLYILYISIVSKFLLL